MLALSAWGMVRLLDVLAPMEVYWAFPGVQTFQHARRLFGAGKYEMVRLARVDGQVVCEGRMTFALGDPGSK